MGLSSPQDVLGLVKSYIPEAVRSEVSEDSELFKAGLIDSVCFIEMISDMEDRHGVRIDLESLEASDLSSARKIFEFLKSRGGKHA